jgi:nucleotide-binding universal stress UspA family protein
MSAPVLAAVDPVALDAAPARFAALAAGHAGTTLVVLAVYGDDEGIDPLPAGQLGEGLARDATPAFAVAAQAAGEVGVSAETLAVAATSPPRGIELAAAQLGAALLVVGSSAGGKPGRVARGSTAARLLCGAPCGVAVVPTGWQPGHGLTTVATGFVDTLEGRAALRSAHALAARAGARLRVLAALQRQPWMNGPTEDELRARAENAAEAAASGLLGAPVDIDIEIGNPAAYLLDASAEVDVLVCGGRGYGAAETVFQGGVTREVTAAARCPVIVLPRGLTAPIEPMFAQAASAA